MKWPALFEIDLNTRNRVFGLDLLRAIGIILVIEAHAYHLIVEFLPKGFLFIPLLDKVCFSFILSGYLIGTTFLKLYNRTDFGASLVMKFWIRRWIRTIPAYFIVISVLVLLRYTFTTVGFVFPWRHYLFVQNLFYPEADPYYFYPEGWSLAVEEWFYFLVPALVLIGHYILSYVLTKRQMVLSIIISIIVICTGLRVHRAMHTPDIDIYSWNIMFRKIVLLRLDTLMYGVLAAFVRYYYRSWWEQYRQQMFYVFMAGMAVTLMGYPFFVHHSMWLKTFYITQVGIIVMMLVPKLEGMKTAKGWWLPFATYLSKVSFCVYLLNRTPILKSLMQLFPVKNLATGLIEYASYVLILLAAATLMHKHIEKPILDLRERIPVDPVAQ